MKKKRTKRLIAIPLAVGAFMLLLASCTARDLAVEDCISNPSRPAVLVKSGTATWPGNNVIPNNTPVDMRNYVRTATQTVMLLEGGDVANQRNNLCLVGGTFATADDPVNTPWEVPTPPDPDGPGPLPRPPTPPHWHAMWGIVIEVPDLQLIGPTVRNTGDGFMIRKASGRDFKIIGARLDADPAAGLPDGAYIHDDCVEDDVMVSGQILDSKFDGCHVFISANFNWNDTGQPGYDGSGNTIVVANSLVRLQPMYNSFCPVVDLTISCRNGYGYDQHGGFFKWSVDALPPNGAVDADGKAPNLELRNTIFRVDQPAAYGGNELGKLGVPPRSTCDNVVIVGWEIMTVQEQTSWIACAMRGPAVGEDGIPNLQAGTPANWDTAVAEWDEAHPYPIPTPVS